MLVYIRMQCRTLEAGTVFDRMENFHSCDHIKENRPNVEFRKAILKVGMLSYNGNRCTFADTISITNKKKYLKIFFMKILV